MSDQKKNILVVEDEVDLRELYATVLRGENYHVDLASQGEEALAMLRGENAYNLLLLDLRMPLMDGWGVLRAIEEGNLRTKISHIIVLTNDLLQSYTHDELVRLGVDGYLVKADLDPGQLVEKVAQYMG